VPMKTVFFGQEVGQRVSEWVRTHLTLAGNTHIHTYNIHNRFIWIYIVHI
jgi:hypothetical protein